MNPVCFINPRKSNARVILEAFADGCGAPITDRLEMRTGCLPVLYGVDAVTQPFYEMLLREGIDHVYIDNAYFGSRWETGLHAKTFYRVTMSAPQHSGLGRSDGNRFAEHGRRIMPWQPAENGHVLISAQSDYWHRRYGFPSARDFAGSVALQIAERTDRKVRVRFKDTGHDRPLAADLKGAWAVVVDCSNVAIDAVLAGIPAFCLRPCAASAMGKLGVDEIEKPVYPDGRINWAGVLADNQWTIQEMRDGVVWHALTGRGEARAAA